MIVGILKEIKTAENRVCMTPAGVEIMKNHGHTVLVEKNAGLNSGFEDADYVEHGARNCRGSQRRLCSGGNWSCTSRNRSRQNLT